MRFSHRSVLLAAAACVFAQTASAEPITLDEAVARALDTAPENAASEAAIEAAQAAREQAAVRPNPTVTVEGENFVGTGPYNVLGQAELTATYNQIIERGGKREARIGLAEREIAVSEAAAEVTRLEVAAAVQRAFIDVLIADAVLDIARSRVAVEMEMRSEAIRRVRGYKDPLFVETRANARVSAAQLQVEQAVARREAALALLASFWGGSPVGLEPQGQVLALGAVPTGLAEADVVLAEAEADRARSAVVVEQTRRTPDYQVGGGLRFLRGTNDLAAVASVTIPLGRFDRNQGNIARAQAEGRRVEALAEATRIARARELADLVARAEASRRHASRLVSEVFPQTERTLVQVREGYARGGFAFRDVQDAADAILAVQDQWLEAITEYRDLLTRIDRLTGRFDASQPAETLP